MTHWTNNKKAIDLVMSDGILPDRCIPKIENRKNLKLWEIDESKLYYFLRTHPFIDELDSMPSFEENSYFADRTNKDFLPGCRYYIDPRGKFFKMAFFKTGLNHVSIEEELAGLEIIPNITFDLSRNNKEPE